MSWAEEHARANPGHRVTRTLGAPDVCHDCDEPDPVTLLRHTKPVLVEMTFQSVDPELLGLLTGGALDIPPKPEFSLDIVTPPIPVRRRAWRVVWEWLTRTPRKYHPATFTHFPRVRVSGNEED